MRCIFPLVFLLFLTLFCQRFCQSELILTTSMISKVALTFYHGIKTMMDKKKEGLMSEDNSRVLGALNSISSDYQEMRDRILSKISNDLKNKITDKTDDFFNRVATIQRLYEKFVRIYRRGEDGAPHLEDTIVQEFAEEVTSPTRSVIKKQIDSMYHALFFKDFVGDSVINILLKESTVSMNQDQVSILSSFNCKLYIIFLGS